MDHPYIHTSLAFGSIQVMINTEQKPTNVTMPPSSHSVQVPPSNLAPTWQKYVILALHCERLSIADKRHIFATLRTHTKSDCNDMHNWYLPKYGITLGEFALFHTIGEHIRRQNCQTK